MKWILIASMLNFQPVYDDQQTCEVAAGKISQVYYQQAAICIPKPAALGSAGEEADRVFESFYKMIEKIQKLEQQRLDTVRR